VGVEDRAEVGTSLPPLEVVIADGRRDPSASSLRILGVTSYVGVGTAWVIGRTLRAR
jgi:hypothetical protein